MRTIKLTVNGLVNGTIEVTAWLLEQGLKRLCGRLDARAYAKEIEAAKNARLHDV